MMSGRRILACLVALCGILGFLLISIDNTYTELVFSNESGFYEEPFELEIYAPPGTQIFYTLDGSDPDENAIPYTRPIRIDDATQNENVYSLRTDVAGAFSSDNMDDPRHAYIVPDYNIDKCTIVRSVYRDANGYFSDIKTKCYFVGYAEKSGYDNINIISIVTDPDNLFDYETGIYVLGHTYDEYIKENLENFGTFEEDWWSWNANYFQEGFEWERAANIQLFDSERNLLIDKNCGIRIQGGASRALLPRSINIYAREQYDNEGRFYIDLFHTDYIADTITLFAGGNDRLSKFRDMLASRLVGGRNFATMHYIPCAMFLDGEYWGVYWFTEKYNDVYLGYYYNVDKDNIIMLKRGHPEEGEEYYELYTQMMDYMTNNDLSIDENYRYACELIDIESYIDYYASEIYIGNIDWPNANEALWRAAETGDVKYEDGKWRWMLYDVNYHGSLDSSNVGFDNLFDAMDCSQMFYNLCQNESFKRQFTTTFMDLVNTSFTNENVNSLIAEQVALMEKPTTAHLKRFYGAENTHMFMDEISNIQDFFNHRKMYIVQYLKDDLGLTGILASVELEINDSSAGSVILNSIEPSFSDDGKWSGEYYTDYPITLTAAANDGYRFVRWEYDSLPKNESMEETVTLFFAEEGVTIKAVFEQV